ncbi:aldose 1-epimerase [Qipengyuania sp. GH1]|uniref:aldose 1-epimerase n=1 Tax=Qipengyuania aestuarii TaxID=2867241 RepID=UPI001C88B390|nr:aldose 1-epimerase [Qipengyuania aestuarii]MBX7534950.1 aldose 1-epimerase [Qipengyuania aestuarii]
MAEITLTAGLWKAVIRPQTGGCLAGLSRGNLPILREMPAQPDEVLGSACFPLVPYCNRIADGNFAFGDRQVRISPNMAPQRHPLHGLGWKSAWPVTRQAAGSAVLEHAYEGGGEWPWSYLARQHIVLDEEGCTIALQVENRASDAAPLGLGLHPYFRRSATTQVRFDADEMLGIDAEFLPDGTAHPADAFADWSKGSALPEMLIDHCFTGWNGKAAIADDQGIITIQAWGAPFLHVFSPPRSDDLCLEPVNHPPDALNRASASVPSVPAGCAISVAMRIEAG